MQEKQEDMKGGCISFMDRKGGAGKEDIESMEIYGLNWGRWEFREEGYTLSSF